MNDRYNKWLNDNGISESDKEILKNMAEKEKEESFSSDLEFGTAGIRGLMGLGSNKMNKYTVGKATVGLANYLNKHHDNPSVVIAYDTRNNSSDYALDAALILNYYGIKTYLFKEYTSTPELSFAIKYLNCTSGIVITSSHNPKEYNGYKVYNNKGGQIVPPEDDLIIKEVNSLDNFESLKYAPKNNELFYITPDEVHESFVKENEKAIIHKELLDKYAKDIKVTYSSLHGVGIKTAKELLDKYKFNYNIVKEQCIYDGNFTTAPEPNPEYEKNYELGIKYAKENDSDIIILTDPDADRVGAMYKVNNEYKQINGNLIGALFANYILENKNITNNSYMIKSIVSTPLVSKMCEEKGIKCYEVLTGCKNIANKRNELIDKDYLFGFEESLGYMFNINVNDKNGFSSMLSFLEILCYCKSKDITLNDYIENIFKKYGYYKEETLSFVYSGLDGKDIINNYMNSFRNDTIKFSKKHTKKDYLNEENELHTNALKYVFEDNSWIMLRPSGTEPKIKVYLGVKCDSEVSSINELNELKSQIKKIFKVEN